MTQLSNTLAAGCFALTAEVIPPLSAAPQRLLDLSAPLTGLVDAVNVTDAAGARATMSSFAAGALLAKAGHDPVVQIACRDRNRIALIGDLLGVAALGVGNILVLHGDDPQSGDQPDAKPVHDLDSRGVMALARDMRDGGNLPSGRVIDPPPALFIGAADTPFDPPPDWQPQGLLAKAEAGADFVQTQFCYDIDIARRYVERLSDAGLTERLHILLGVGPIASVRSARWMNENLHGVTVPDHVIARMEAAADPAAEGRIICAELIQAYEEMPGVAGVHIMAPQQRPAAIAQVIEESAVLKRRAPKAALAGLA